MTRDITREESICSSFVVCNDFRVDDVKLKWGKMSDTNFFH